MARPQSPFPDKEAILALADAEDRLQIRVTPGAAHARIELPAPQAPPILHICVTTPPKDGKANKAVIKLLASALGIAGGRITLLRGEAGRGKMIQIESKRKS